MAGGTLLAESLKLNVPLDALPLTVNRIVRLGPLEDLPPGQPVIWTFVEFEVDDAEAPQLAEMLASVLDGSAGWYCDLRTATDTFVVFADRVFTYRRGDEAGRAAAAEYARSVGVPDSQVDWPE